MREFGESVNNLFHILNGLLATHFFKLSDVISKDIWGAHLNVVYFTAVGTKLEEYNCEGRNILKLWRFVQEFVLLAFQLFIFFQTWWKGDGYTWQRESNTGRQAMKCCSVKLIDHPLTNAKVGGAKGLSKKSRKWLQRQDQSLACRKRIGRDVGGAELKVSSA